LDERRVVPPVTIILRAPAPPIIEAIDIAGPFRMFAEIGGERGEVPAVARQSGQANDAPELLVRCRVMADIEPQVVERRIVDVSPQLAIKLGHLSISTLGACLTDWRRVPLLRLAIS